MFLFRCSTIGSLRLAVNQEVAGSNPATGAILLRTGISDVQEPLKLLSLVQLQSPQPTLTVSGKIASLEINNKKIRAKMKNNFP